MLKFLRRKQPDIPAAQAAVRADADDVPKLPAVDMLDGQPGELSSPLEIAHLLRSVRDEQSLALIAPVGGAESGVTTLVEVGQQADVLVFAGLPEDAYTQALLQARGPFMVSTSAEQIFVTFDIQDLEPTSHFGRPAIKARLPRSITYMQRRDSFRIHVPASRGVTCTILAGSQPIHPTAGTLAVRDLSVTGLALADAAQVIDPEPGRVYGGRLDIPKVGEFDVTFSVIHATDEDPAAKAAGNKTRRVGCAFVDMPQGVRIRIQSFIGGLQREEIMRQRGLL